MKISYPKLHSIRFKTGPFTDNVVHIYTKERDVPVINVLHGVAESMLNEVVLFGYDKNGKEYIAGSSSNIQRAAYMFARGHLNMLRIADE